MSNSFLASDGNRIAYTIDDFTDPWQPPATLLLLHAAMGSSKRWYAAVPPLCRHYRVVRMDLRGHGESQVPPPEPPLSMDRLVQDVRELLDHLDCGPVHIVGNSAGGYLAQNLAMASPERVRSLMLFGSTPGLKNSQAHTWLPRVAREGLRNFLAATIEDRFPHGHDRGHIEWFLDEAAKNDTAYIGRFVGLMTTLWWADELPRIKCPTLLVMPGAETVGQHAELRDHAGEDSRLRADHLRGPAAQHLRHRAGSLCRRHPGIPAQAVPMKLSDIAQVVRSKNAGPRRLTLDLMFATDADYRRVAQSPALGRERIGALYGVPADDVTVIPYPVGRAIKIVLARPIMAGDPGDRDVYGAQQHAPLLGVEI